MAATLYLEYTEIDILVRRFRYRLPKLVKNAERPPPIKRRIGNTDCCPAYHNFNCTNGKYKTWITAISIVSGRIRKKAQKPILVKSSDEMLKMFGEP